MCEQNSEGRNIRHETLTIELLYVDDQKRTIPSPPPPPILPMRVLLLDHLLDFFIKYSQICWPNFIAL